MKARAIYKYENDDGKEVTVKSQWFVMSDFDPVNGESQFDWNDGGYSGFDDVDWKTELKWEFKL